MATAPASLMRSGLARRIAGVLFVPFCGAMLAAVFFGHFLVQTRSAPAHINLAGRQRMLAVQLGDWARMVEGGQDEDRAKLRVLVATFEGALRVLERGGHIEGRPVEPVPEGPRAELERQRRLWDELRPRLLAVADHPRQTTELDRAARGIVSATEALRVSADTLTGALEARTQTLQRETLWVLGASVLLNFIVLVLGVWYARTHIIRPILLVDGAARRVSEGDYSVRVTCNTRDELSSLAETFNRMSARVSGLLEALDVRRRHAETLTESLPIGTALLDAALTVRGTNRAFREMLGLEGNETHNRPLEEVLQHAELTERLRAMLGNGAMLHGLTFEQPTPVGVRLLRVTATPTRFVVAGDEQPEARLLLVVEDLTGEEKLRSEARAAEEGFRSLIEGSPEGIAVHRDGRLVYVNPALLAYLGYERDEELIGTPVLDLFHPQDREAVVARIRTVHAAGKPLPPAEERFVRKDGSVIHAEVVGLRLVFGGEPSLVAIAHDVTERKQITAKMMEMDRMIAVGSLAAAVGHEINNPLCYAIANLDFVAERLPAVVDALRTHHDAMALVSGRVPAPVSSAGPLAELVGALGEAQEGAARVRNIVRDLKTVSRADEDRRAPLDLRRLVESSINMAWNEIRHRARLVKDFGDVPPVEANEARLGQVFINLLVNAAQAIPEGAADENTIHVRTFSDGDRAVIEVEDTGAGIAEEHLERLFEPFFTTKPMGQGTGLGLAICRQTVEAHGGQIVMVSEVGRGTTFRVSLPAAAAPTRLLVPSTPSIAAPSSRRGRILVVDDEPLVGRALQRGLRSEHEVVTETRARQAKERIVSGDSFDIILCDLMMPEMTGMDLHAALRAAAPAQADRMIFLTGGAFTPRARQFLDDVPNQCIEKPFDLEDLRALLRDRLG